MTTGWTHRRAFIDCDNCHDFIEGDGPSVTDLWNEAKADGWRARKFTISDPPVDYWVHHCPKCGPIPDLAKPPHINDLLTKKF